MSNGKAVVLDGIAAFFFRDKYIMARKLFLDFIWFDIINVITISKGKDYL